MSMTVVKRSGAIVDYDPGAAEAAIRRAATGLPSESALVAAVLQAVSTTTFDGMSTADIDTSIIKAAAGKTRLDPAFDFIAARTLLSTIYRPVIGHVEGAGELSARHAAHFPAFIAHGIELGLLDKRLGTDFDLEAIAGVLDTSRDLMLRYLGVSVLRHRYMQVDKAGDPIETPQYFFARVSMGLSLNEADPTAAAIGFYESISRLEYMPAGSTLINAGTPTPQLSNCFVLEMQDDIGHITKTWTDITNIAKGTGGIGYSCTRLRANGSLIHSNNTHSTGPISFQKVTDTILRAVSRGGKKLGAAAIYMENWHLDFPSFLDLRQQSGDPYRRTPTANTAAWVSDEFMARVDSDDDWYLFDPADAPELVDLYGAEFSARYRALCADAESGRITFFKKMKARDLWGKMMVSLKTTSHPWVTFKDATNVRMINDNTGTIHSLNLCTEVALPQDRDNTSVCNLASINLPVHFRDGEINRESIRTAVRLAIRQLDNLIDITVSNVPEAEHSNAMNRALGLGVMGITDLAELMGMAYDDPRTAVMVDEVVEFVSYCAIEASCDLAQERGSYPNFAGSGWSRGLVPFDTIERLGRQRGRAVAVDMSSTMDWDHLRGRVKNGMRNSTVMAIAPTATIGTLVGTTPGTDPNFTLMFARKTAMGNFVEINRNLVAACREAGIWERVREELLASGGDLDAVADVPSEIREVFKTSYKVDPLSFVTVAARAQKWIDQAISRNIYVDSQNVEDYSRIYRAAWSAGLKSTYYLHTKPATTAESSTRQVAKSAAGGGGGFGAARASAAPAPAGGFGSVSAPAAAPARVGFGAGTSSPVAAPAGGSGFGAAAAKPSPLAPPGPARASAGARSGFGAAAAATAVIERPAGSGFGAATAAPKPATPPVPGPGLDGDGQLVGQESIDLAALAGAPEGEQYPQGQQQAPEIEGRTELALSGAADIACPIDPAEREACEACQ